MGLSFPTRKLKRAQKSYYHKTTKQYSDDREIANVFGNCFNSITQLIEVPDYQPPDDKYTFLNDPIEKAIEKYKQHPSILKITDSMKTFNSGFDFSHCSSRETYDTIQSCKNNKASTHIPIKYS